MQLANTDELALGGGKPKQVVDVDGILKYASCTIAALQKREEKMWEKSRQKRVQGWRSWSNGAGVVKNKIPRVKEERRADGSSGYNQGNDERGMGYRKDWR